MKIQILPFSFIFIFLLGCKTDVSSHVTAPAEESTAVVNTVVDEELLDQEDYEDDPYENDQEDLNDYPDFVYLDFDIVLVIDYLQLNITNDTRSLKELLTSDLRKSDALVPSILETGDGTFDIYKLVSNGVDIAYFYYEADVITTIEIIDSAGVPDDMISPGLSFGDLSATYENPVAYGSEIEGRVFVHIDQIGFRMDAGWGNYEPIDLEDDTEILYIQF